MAKNTKVYHFEPYMAPVTIEVRYLNPSPGTICFKKENDDNRIMRFLTVLSLSSGPEISQNLGLGQMGH
jgi:hypothetical protein